MPMADTRLVRMLAQLGYGSRRQIRTLLQQGRFTDADGRVPGPEAQIAHADIRFDGMPLDPPFGMLIALHKPRGYTCSHQDAGPLVHDLLPGRFRLRRPLLSTIGRLDRDTSGLLLLTDDGALLHRIISPRRHVPKVYRVELAEPLRGDETQLFAAGGLRLKGEDRPLAPAGLEVLGERLARIRLTEGRYHQVRRMFAACGNRVTTLHREAIGQLRLDDLALTPGAWRCLSDSERERLEHSVSSASGHAITPE